MRDGNVLEIVFVTNNAVKCDIFASMKVKHSVVPHRFKIEEAWNFTEKKKWKPNKAVLEVCREKAFESSLEHFGKLVICTETILVRKGKTFRRPKNADEASKQIRELQGSRHTILTAFCVFLGGKETCSCIGTTDLEMKPLSGDDISSIVKEMGNSCSLFCGGYDLDKFGGIFSEVRGSASSARGFPMEECEKFLKSRNFIGNPSKIATSQGRSEK